MNQDHFYPFYLKYQDMEFWEEERLNERENRLMQSFYPRTARDIQDQVTAECDRNDYPGSYLYDEYPDRFSMERSCGRIKQSLDCSACKDEALMDELIHILLYQEMRRRRCRKHRCRRFF